MLFRKAVLIAFFMASLSFIYANDFAQSGTRFWICFEKNYKNFEQTPVEMEKLKIIIVSEVENSARLKSFNGKLDAVVNLKPYEEAVVNIDDFFEIDEYDSAVNKGIFVESEAPVFVSGFNNVFQTSEAFTVIPEDMLGVEYFTVNSHNSVGYISQAAVLAVEDGTIVKIEPSDFLDNYKFLSTVEIELNKGEVYQLGSECKEGFHCDLTGTHIKANKKIAVFSGHQCGYVPYEYIACNHLVENLYPIEFFGKEFIAGKLRLRSYSTVRIVASEDDTEIKINGFKQDVLNKGEAFISDNQNNTWLIQTSKPAIAAQFSQGFKNGDSVGDPMMILLRNENLTLDKYFFYAPTDRYWKNFVNIAITPEGLKSLEIDGKIVNPDQFEKIMESDLLFAGIFLDKGLHIIKSKEKFRANFYGFGYDKDSFDAYGHM